MYNSALSPAALLGSCREQNARNMSPVIARQLQTIAFDRTSAPDIVLQSRDQHSNRASTATEQVCYLSDAPPLKIQDRWYQLLPTNTQEMSPVAAESLCELCSGITTEALERDHGYAHHTTPAASIL